MEFHIENLHLTPEQEANDWRKRCERKGYENVCLMFDSKVFHIIKVISF